jgi:acyl-[acyl-carrier-protein]-phospholipid O-acyltransferase/long-chain-fatty-acid--[acyl-carrier-protein] ligase
MLGYLLNDQPGVLVPPGTELGRGWYDTGDIVTIDPEGFVRISGRAKRFAKVAGEMVSLTSVEALAGRTWPEAVHAAIALPDERKGEQVVLLTTAANADRAALMAQAQADGIAEISVPRRILEVAAIPVLGTGKTDYVAAARLVEAAA